MVYKGKIMKQDAGDLATKWYFLLAGLNSGLLQGHIRQVGTCLADVWAEKNKQNIRGLCFFCR